MNHNQFFFQQMGWIERGSRRELVVFDLETLSLRPRFVDSATVIGSLSQYTGRREVILYQRYLAHYQQLSGVLLNPKDAYIEMRWLRVVEMIESLPWLVDWVQNSSAPEAVESLRMVRRKIRFRPFILEMPGSFHLCLLYLQDHMELSPGRRNSDPSEGVSSLPGMYLIRLGRYLPG